VDEPLLALLRKLVMSAGHPDVDRRNGLFGEHGDKFVILESSAIDLIEAARNYVVIHAGNATYCHRASISELERALDPGHFVRVHKSYLLNFSRVESVQNDFKVTFVFRFSSGATCRSGPTYRDKIRSPLRPSDRDRRHDA
jgi:DNA-binding LytR/AlgR family response regulator